MENRFGFKEFVLVLLMVVVIVMVGLAMKQFDRQWEDVRDIKNKLDAQARDIESLRQLMRQAPAHGVGVATTQSQAAPRGLGLDETKGGNPFKRILEAKAMPDYADGGWFIDGFSGGVAKITPLVSGDAYASVIQGSVLETLCTRDPDTLEWRGLIARDWEIEDLTAQWDQYFAEQVKSGIDARALKEAIATGADEEEWKAFAEKSLKAGLTQAQLDAIKAAARGVPDAVVIKFKIREGVVFSDGKPVTADDVKFSFDFIMDPRIAAPRQRAYLRMIREVRKLGPYEVSFHYREPYFESFQLAASVEVLPKHFYGKFEPEAFNESVGLLLGTGAYKLEDPESWRPGKLLQVVRNDRYWGVRPAYERLVYREISNDVARLTAFRNGDIDLFSAPPEQYREMLNDAPLVERTQHYEYQSPVGGYRYLAWNQLRKGKATPFADRRVRQAMTMLTDRERMIQQIMHGYAALATGPFNPLSKQYDPQVKPWPYDVHRAKELLSAAGYKDRDNDGVLEGQDGQPFRFKLTYPSGSANYEAMVLFLKDSYARAGILLAPDPLEWAVFTERLGNKDFDAITLGWTAGIETDIFQMFHSSQMIIGGDNFMSYKSPELDELIDKARRTINEEERMPLWHRAHQVLSEDQPYTFLFFGKSLRFMDGRIRNVQIIKLGMNGSEEWFVPAALQRKAP